MAEKQELVPRSTYRLQFNKNFRLSDARKLVPYFHGLGISHCYASPILKASAGSMHGYDIIDHNQINPEVGTEEDLRAFVSELKTHGMGLVLDTVPNHMGVGFGTNPWWQDVLQNGRASEHADFFDIDWEPLKPELHGKVLLPVLGNQYGDELEQGNIQVVHSEGEFSITCFDKRFPLDPQTLPLLFEPVAPTNSQQFSDFYLVLGQLRLLPENRTSDTNLAARRRREAPALLSSLERLVSNSPEVRALVHQALAAVNGKPGDPHSFDALHHLLEAQAYRLAFWRVSAEEINYRRFFDINDLVGLRMENPRVFAETHKLIRRWLGEGLVTGIRIDHPDGLLNPTQYFRRLQRLYCAARCCGPEPVSPVAETGIELEVDNSFAEHTSHPHKAPLYLLVEKILEHGEELPQHWAVDGTVGYEFANLVNGIFIDRRNERHFTKLYQRFIEKQVDVERVIYDSKKLIMDDALASEINVLAHILEQISIRNRHARDFTLSVLWRAIRETIAYFPVYRTYIDERGRIEERDRRYIQQAIERAKRRAGNLAPAVFDFLQSVLLLQGADDSEPIFGYRQQLYFTLKFQQLTGPVMAKGLEDTAFYVYARFVSLNEVGGWPAEFGVTPAEFHRRNQIRAVRVPDSMLTTSTHDTKRSEDVRARLDVLSEMPRQWATEVMKWRRTNRSRKVRLEDERLVPDNNEEYLLYQTLVGTWPLEMHCGEAHEVFTKRVQQYMQKAIHEAKVSVSWINQNPDYVAGMNSFIERILSPELRGRPNFFWESLQTFLPPVVYFGAINSLAQTLLKLTAPGVPDVYQGQELFDFSLVDPDNRRPVHFDERQRALADLMGRAQSGDIVALCKELLADWRSGRIKLWLTTRALQFRRNNAALFRVGSYIPLELVHARDEHAIAFARIHEEGAVVVAVPRMSYTLMKGHPAPPVGGAWNDMQLTLPDPLKGSAFRDIFTNETVRATPEGRLLCREVFRHLPYALLSIP